jgi:hypothetical protein
MDPLGQPREAWKDFDREVDKHEYDPGAPGVDQEVLDQIKQQIENIIYSLKLLSSALSACECDTPEECCDENGVPGCCDSPNPPDCCNPTECNPCEGVGNFEPVPWPNECESYEGCLCVDGFPMCL